MEHRRKNESFKDDLCEAKGDIIEELPWIGFYSQASRTTFKGERFSLSSKSICWKFLLTF